MIITRKTTTTTVEEFTVRIDARQLSIESSTNIEKEIEKAKDLLESVGKLNLNHQQD